MSIITLENVRKFYRTSDVETLALDSINLKVEPGEFISIMGPSGCGKSTLLNIMGLLDKPTAGRVIIEDCPTDSFSDSKTAALRNSKLGFVFQSFHLIPSLNVADNVAMPLMYRSGMTSAECRRRVMEALEKVEISHRSKHLPSQLSGGQCQRVAIARAIVGSPAVVFADEPTGNLDSRMSAQVMDLLHRLNSNEGKTIVMVTHNESQAADTDRIVRMHDGRIIM